MLTHWIWLTTRPGVGPRTALSVLEAFPDIAAAYYARDYSEVPGLDDQARASLADKSLAEAERIWVRCQNLGIHLLTYSDGLYPQRLRCIPDPPVLLYYKGYLPDFDAEPVIAMVGTRSASVYGCVTAKRLGFQIVKCGGVVVSGLAGGIDSMAMRGALMGDGAPVGVLGCGVDVVYPRFNRELYLDTEARGCLISEYPPGTPPSGWNFPRRNRIISGLSCGVLVVEAPAKSGALITAQHALNQGRDVFAVPGNIDSPCSVGSNELLRQGAVAVQRAWDVMREYESLFPDKVRQWIPGMILDTSPEELTGLREAVPVRSPKTVPASKKSRKKDIDNGNEPPYHDHNARRPELSSDEERVYALLSQTLRHVDEVIAAAELPAARVLAALTLLEVKGMVVRHPGKFYSLARPEARKR